MFKVVFIIDGLDGPVAKVLDQILRFQWLVRTPFPTFLCFHLPVWMLFLIFLYSNWPLRATFSTFLYFHWLFGRRLPHSCVSTDYSSAICHIPVFLLTGSDAVSHIPIFQVTSLITSHKAKSFVLELVQLEKLCWCYK